MPLLSMSTPPYDLFSRAFKANPFPTFAIMREADPIYPHLAPNGTTIWYITRYEDVIACLRDNEHFVKDIRQALPPEQLTPARRTTMHQLINENMLFADPPDHTRLRALVSQAFTPRRIENLRPRLHQLAQVLLEQVAPLGHMDLIADYALPLPVVIIADLLGIPEADRTAVADWSQAIISPGSRGHTYKARKHKVRALVTYLRELFKERGARPQDDLITALVQAEMAGDKLSEAELSSMVALLIVTGHETTVNLIGNGALALLTHPAQRALVQENPALLAQAIEELLRFDGPVESSTTRWVGQTFTYKGFTLNRGDVVRLVFTSANRDAAAFDHPNTLDITRPDNKHLAFGLGIHYCLGAPLARLEGEIAFHTLFHYFPTLQLAVPPEQLLWRSGVLFRGLQGLPVCWEVKNLA